jgi:hypothetical protein
LFTGWATELSSLFGGHSAGQIGLFDLDISENEGSVTLGFNVVSKYLPLQLIALQVTDKIVRECDNALHSVTQLNIAQMVQQIAHLKLGAFGHLHGQQTFGMFIFTLSVKCGIPCFRIDHDQQLLYVLVGNNTNQK